METVHTIIVGGGQAGLAMSRSLAARGVEHIVLERGRVGDRWMTERWDSLRLLTPNWLSRLSGWDPGTDDPHAFMKSGDFASYLTRFAAHHQLPTRTGVSVLRVERFGEGFRVDTDHGAWLCRAVVVATGQSQAAGVPEPLGRGLDSRILQVVSTRYRCPHTLPDGGVLVVGASATGVQLASEIQRTGRPVTLAVGRHTRLPRRYRGRDILEWLHKLGTLTQATGSLPNPAASRGQPSMQLVGSEDHADLDLGILSRRGVRLVGRAAAADGSVVRFADDLVENLAASDFKLAGLRRRIDAYADDPSTPPAPDAEPFVPTPLPESAPSLDLRREGIRSVVWAVGFTRSYPWLRVPVTDRRGEIIHSGGITPVRGLYVLGMNLQRTRMSSFVGGVGADADVLAQHLVESDGGLRRSVA